MSLGRQYCIWYLDKSTHGREVISGVADSWTSAELLARRLYTIRKKVDLIENVSTGIFLFMANELYTGRPPARWQVMPLLTSNT